MRAYTDEELRVGMRLEIDLILTDEHTARCWARVAWVDKLPDTAGARFDVGLEFVDMSDEHSRLLRKALADDSP